MDSFLLPLLALYLFWAIISFWIAMTVSATNWRWGHHYVDRLFGPTFLGTIIRILVWPLIMYRARREWYAEQVAAKLSNEPLRDPLGFTAAQKNVWVSAIAAAHARPGFNVDKLAKVVDDLQK